MADATGFIKGFGDAQTALANMQRNVANTSKKFADIGKSLSSAGDKLTSKITKPALVATSALAGVALVKGFNRLTGIDDARAKLMGLGHDAESVEEIMVSALDAVRGTAFGMDEAATTAASAVAAGIKPGKELTRYLALTGDAAAIAGASLGDMGSIVNKVQTSNKAYNDSLGQLSDRGLPIYQWLAKEAKVTEEAVFDMASKGKISSKMFLDAIENNIGGAAKTIGENSFTAAISNIGASIGRIGANFLDAGGAGGGFFSTIKPLLTDFNNSLGAVEEKAAVLGEKFGAAFNSFLDKAVELKGKFDGLSPSMQGVILKATAIGAAVLVGLGPALKILGSLTTGFGALLSVVGFLLSPIGLIVTGIVALGVAFGLAMTKSEGFRNAVFGAFETIRNTVMSVVSAIGPVLQSMFSGAISGVTGFVTSLVDGFKSAGGEFSTLSTLFIAFNPILKLAMIVLSEFGPQIAEGFSQIASLALPMLNLLGETLGQLAAAVIPMVLNVVATLIPIIITLGTAIMEIAMAAIPILVEVFNQLVPVVMSLVATVIGLVSQLAPLVSTVIDMLVPVLMMLIGTILNIVEMVAPALIAIIGAVIAIFQAIMPVVMQVLSTVIDVMASIIAAVMPIISVVLLVITTIIGIIAPIVTFIAGIIASIFNIITPIITFVTGVFGTVFSIISGTFQKISHFISGSIQTISGAVAKLSGVFSGVFNSIWATVSSVMSSVSSKIQGVFTAITTSWTGLKTFVGSVFSGIGDNMKTLVDRVKGFVNVVIGSINSAIGLINKIPGVSIGKIPQLQRGTDDWGGGFAKMNEGGRGELVKLPNGSQVIPHDVSMKYAREAGQASGRQGYSNQSDETQKEKQPINIYIRNEGDLEYIRTHVNHANAVDQEVNIIGGV